MRYLRKILFLLFLLIAQTSYAAFPTTSLLDNFTRADVGPPPSASWGGIIFPTGDSGLRVISNQCEQVSLSGSNSSYWGTSFNADQEVYFTIITKATINGLVIELFIRLQVPGTSGYDGYVIDWANISAGTDAGKLYRVDNNGYTQLGATVSQEFSAGDAIGLSAVGTDIFIQYAPAGVWGSPLTSRDGSTYNIAGYIGAGIEGSAALYRLDDFSGGNIPAAVAGTIPDQAILF